MIAIERRIKDAEGRMARREYAVYTEEEAREKGIEYRHWKGGSFSPGDWVASDDGYVAQVVRVNGPYTWRGRTKYELVLPYAKVWTVGTTRKLNFEDFHEKGVYCWHAPRRWIDQEIRKERFKTAIRQYAFLYITQGGVLSDEQMLMIGNTYRKTEKHPDWSFKRILKTHEAKTVLKKELNKLMEEHGVTPEHVIRQHQSIIDRAIHEGQLAVAEKANSRFIEMLDLMPDKTTSAMSLTERVTFGHLSAGDGAVEDAHYQLEESNVPTDPA